MSKGLDDGIDVNGNAGTVAKVLGAIFGGGSLDDHPEYVGIGLTLLDGGMSYESLMQLAIQARLGGASDDHAAVVDLLYFNVMDDHPSAHDLAEFVGLLDNGTFTAGAWACWPRKRRRTRRTSTSWGSRLPASNTCCKVCGGASA